MYNYNNHDTVEGECSFVYTKYIPLHILLPNRIGTNDVSIVNLVIKVLTPPLCVTMKEKFTAKVTM